MTITNGLITATMVLTSITEVIKWCKR